MFSDHLRRKVEQYTHSCGVAPSQDYIDYAPTGLRAMSRFTFSLGVGFVKEVQLPGGSNLALEPGVKLMLSRLLYVRDSDPNGSDFTLYPWGAYLNLSFFRN